MDSVAENVAIKQASCSHKLMEMLASVGSSGVFVTCSSEWVMTSLEVSANPSCLAGHSNSLGVVKPTWINSLRIHVDEEITSFQKATNHNLRLLS
jgi:hypothetical protein